MFVFYDLVSSVITEYASQATASICNFPFMWTILLPGNSGCIMKRNKSPSLRWCVVIKKMSLTEKLYYRICTNMCLKGHPTDKQWFVSFTCFGISFFKKTQ